METRRAIALDTETTGFDPHTGDRIVEIGCIEMINGIATDNHYHVRIYPDRLVPAAATAVHGLTDEMLAGCPKFAEIVQGFLDFIGEDMLVIHNADFDLGFINYELKLCKLPPLKNPVTDTLVESRRRWPGKTATLDALCNRFNIDRSQRVLHGALIDADLLAQVFAKMFSLDSLSFMQDQSAARAAATAAPADIGTSARKPRPHRGVLAPTEAELEAHSAFIGRIENSIWAVLAAG